MSGSPRAQRLIALPPGQTIHDVLPQYSAVVREYGPIGKPCSCCAGCSKPFTAARKPRIGLRLYPVHFPVPVSFLYRLCGKCARDYRAGAVRRDRLMAAIEKFVMGDGQAI